MDFPLDRGHLGDSASGFSDLVRYCGWYSNKSRGLHLKATRTDAPQAIDGTEVPDLKLGPFL